MTHATDACDALTDPLSQAERDAIFHTKERWPGCAVVTLAWGAICVLIITEHLWRPILAEWGW